MNIIISDKNIHIRDSYEVRTAGIKRICMSIHRDACERELQVSRRSPLSMRLEWYCHNFLYNLHIARHRTKDVDLDYPQKWWYRVGYALGGLVAYLFIE